jgi:hypothetical protein
VVWLAVNIVLPVTLLNSAAILVVLAVLYERRKALFAILALVGGCYMLLDIANGWFSAIFVHNVVGDPRWITAFVYINAAAVGVSIWVLVQPLWSKARGIAATNKRRGILLSGGVLALVVAAAMVVPVVYHFLPDPLVHGSPQVPAQVPGQPETSATSYSHQDSGEQPARPSETGPPAEQARVERAIIGEWRLPNDPAGSLATLTISRDGDTFSAEYRSTSGLHPLQATISADGQLRLESDQVGKLVNPYKFWQGDFSQEAWGELSADNSQLTFRFTEAAEGSRTVVLDRIEEASHATVATSDMSTNETKESKRLNIEGLSILSAVHPDFNDAKRSFEQAVQLEPNNVEALNNLGYVYYRLGDYSSAEPILIKVIELAPTRKVAQGNLGEVQAKLGKTQDAANHFCQYVRLFDSLQRGKSILARTFNDPDPNVQSAVSFTLENCN